MKLIILIYITLFSLMTANLRKKRTLVKGCCPANKKPIKVTKGEIQDQPKYCTDECIFCEVKFKDNKLKFINLAGEPVVNMEPTGTCKKKDQTLEPRFVYHAPTDTLCIHYLNLKFDKDSDDLKSLFVQQNHQDLKKLISEKKKIKTNVFNEFTGGEVWIVDGNIEWISPASGFFSEKKEIHKKNFEYYVKEYIIKQYTSKDIEYVPARIEDRYDGYMQENLIKNDIFSKIENF
jgi:hypothetical protein